MNISFERKILLGYIINLFVVITTALIFISRLDSQRNQEMDMLLNWIELSLFLLSIVLLSIVYIIIRTQIRAKNVSQNLLIENKQLLQSIIDNTSNPIFIKEINGEYLLINKQYESIFHIKNEDIVGKTDQDLLPREIAEEYRNTDLEVVKALKELKTEEKIMQADGMHTYLAVKFPLYDSEGRIYAIGGIATDITERKKNEESLKEAEKFFTMSLDIMIIASHDSLLKVNPSTSKILGYSKEELVGKPLYTFIHPDDIEITRKEVAKLQTGVLTIKFENRWVCKDGSIKWILWSGSADLATGLLYGVGSDITAQKEIQSSLVVSEKFFNMSYDMLAVIRGDYFEKVNPVFLRILGYDAKSMYEAPYISFIYPEHREVFMENMVKLKQGKVVTNHRSLVLCKDSSYKMLDWTSTIDLQTGTIFTVARDVSELIKQEDSLKMADRFYTMAYDILAVIKDEYFIKINPAFTKTLGYSQDDMDRIKFTELIHPEDLKTANKMIAKLLKGFPVINFRFRVRCKTGAYKWLDWSSNIDLQQGILYTVARDITAQVLLENKQQIATNELYENEEKLRVVLENIGEGVVVANTDKKVVMANNVANEIFEIDDDNEISTDMSNHFELYFPDGETVFPSQNLPMERALNGESTDDVDVLLWNPIAREKKRVLISGRPLVDQNDKVVAAVVTIKDISKYVKLEEDLKETELKYRQLIGFKKSADKADKKENEKQNGDKKNGDKKE